MKKWFKDNKYEILLVILGLAIFSLILVAEAGVFGPLPPPINKEPCSGCINW